MLQIPTQVLKLFTKKDKDTTPTMVDFSNIPPLLLVSQLYVDLITLRMLCYRFSYVEYSKLYIVVILTQSDLR